MPAFSRWKVRGTSPRWLIPKWRWIAITPGDAPDLGDNLLFEMNRRLLGGHRRSLRKVPTVVEPHPAFRRQYGVVPGIPGDHRRLSFSEHRPERSKIIPSGRT